LFAILVPKLYVPNYLKFSVDSLNKIFIFIGSSLSFMSYQILSITGYFTACCALHKLSQRGVYSQALCTDRDAAAHADFNTAFRQRA